MSCNPELVNLVAPLYCQSKLIEKHFYVKAVLLVNLLLNQSASAKLAA
jgi:hypothetical protein